MINYRNLHILFKIRKINFIEFIGINKILQTRNYNNKNYFNVNNHKFRKILL